MGENRGGDGGIYPPPPNFWVGGMLHTLMGVNPLQNEGGMNVCSIPLPKSWGDIPPSPPRFTPMSTYISVFLILSVRLILL